MVIRIELVFVNMLAGFYFALTGLEPFIVFAFGHEHLRTGRWLVLSWSLYVKVLAGVFILSTGGRGGEPY